MDNNFVSDVASELIKLVRDPSFDPIRQRDEIKALLKPFVGAEDALFQYGIKRPQPPDRTRMLFYSPELVLQLSRFGPDFRLPVHNHESWNILMICSGSMHFRWYRRLDDGNEPGRAQVEIAEDLVVRAGELGIVAHPPHDIHQLEILEENTWMLTITPCPEPTVREIYEPSEGTFRIKSLQVVPGTPT